MISDDQISIPDKNSQLPAINRDQGFFQKRILRFIDKDLLASQNLRIIAYCGSKPIGRTLHHVLDQLEIESILLNSYNLSKKSLSTYSKTFSELSQAVRQFNANIGIWFDSTGERVYFFDEKGNYVRNDLLVTLFTSDLIKDKKPITCIVTESTTNVISDLVTQVNGRVIRVPVNNGALLLKLRTTRADFVASDNGLYIFPIYAKHANPILTTLKLTEIIARTTKSLSKLIATLPKPVHFYKNILVEEQIFENFGDIIKNNLSAYFSNVILIESPIGMKIYFGRENGWIDITPCRNRNVLRLYAESNHTSFIADSFASLEDLLYESSLEKLSNFNEILENSLIPSGELIE